MGSSIDPDTLAMLKLVQPVVAGVGGVIVGAGALIGLVGAVSALSAGSAA